VLGGHSRSTPTFLGSRCNIGLIWVCPVSVPLAAGGDVLHSLIQDDTEWHSVAPIRRGEGRLTTHCCHSRAEPNVALGVDGAARRSSNLIGAVPLQNLPGSHPQHLRERRLRISPVPHERLGPTSLTDRGFSQPYEISYRGVKLPMVSAALGALLAAVRGGFCRRWRSLPKVSRR
jgi:hypothetical protein